MVIDINMIGGILKVNNSRAKEIHCGLVAVENGLRIGYQIDEIYRSESVWENFCKTISEEIIVVTLSGSESAPIFVNKRKCAHYRTPTMFSLSGELISLEKRLKIMSSISPVMLKLQSAPEMKIFHIKSTAHRCPLVATLLGYPCTWICKASQKLQSADLVSVFIQTEVGIHSYAYSLPKQSDTPEDCHTGEGVRWDRSSIPGDVTMVL